MWVPSHKHTAPHPRNLAGGGGLESSRPACHAAHTNTQEHSPSTARTGHRLYMRHVNMQIWGWMQQMRDDAR